MPSKRTLVAVGFMLGLPSLAFAACGGTGGAATLGAGGAGTGSGKAAGGAAAGGSSGKGGSGGNIFQHDGAACQSAADCDGGVCVSGACCAAADVCSAECCGAGTVCLFDKCVTPGKPCHTANDCGPGHYCETALGGGADGGTDGGHPAVDGGVCLQPIPLEGKCLPIPPLCAGDAGAGGSDGGCVEACEYHPPVGALDAVPKWQWGPVAQTSPDSTDVWSTPAVGRLYDSNCDGQVNELDSPNVIFVSGSAKTPGGVGTCCQCNGQTPTACHTGVLRMLDGRTGTEIWSLTKASAGSVGFEGFSVAIGDLDNDGRADIAAVTGEGFVVLVDGDGNVLRTSDKPIPGHDGAAFGWGGGLSIADMDGDGFPEIAFGATVFTTKGGGLTRLWVGAGGTGGGATEELSTFVDLDGAPDGHLELLAGKTAYRADGSMLWDRPGLPEGFPGVGDFNKDGKPEVVYVAKGQVWIFDGATGNTVLGPVMLPGTGSGGPPTVADFDGDGKPEIGVAEANRYAMLKPNYVAGTIDVVWAIQNHDLSSSVTGSSVFDFDGDGIAEVIYGDECFLWVFEGPTGKVRFATPHTSFTATEASLVADIDGDGHAEMLMVSNGADPSAAGWGCDVAPWNQPDPATGRPAWVAPPGAPAYRGIVAFGDRSNSWVGTRTLWSEHTYHVSNICDDRDNACDPPNVYGSIPRTEKPNWNLPWLNNFRQNVQDKGIFDAPDAVVALDVDCSDPVVLHPAVRNIGLAALPTGVDVGVYKRAGNVDTQVGKATTTHTLFPGQTERLDVTVPPAKATKGDTFVARILIDPKAPKFHECRADNNESNTAKASCNVAK